MTEPLVKRSLAELDTVVEEIIQRNPEWYKEIQQLIAELKNGPGPDKKITHTLT